MTAILIAVLTTALELTVPSPLVAVKALAGWDPRAPFSCLQQESATNVLGPCDSASPCTYVSGVQSSLTCAKLFGLRPTSLIVWLTCRIAEMPKRHHKRKLFVECS